MKTQKRQFGDRGESIACGYLVNRGYEVIKRNFSCKFGEIDIIAKKDDDMIFVEVKTRTSTSFGQPQEFVDWKKLERMNMAIDCFLGFYNIKDDKSFRIDVIEVLFDANGKYSLNHIEDFNN